MATDTREQARRYAGIRYRLIFIGLAVNALALALLQFSGAAAGIAAHWQTRFAAFPLALAGIGASFWVILYAVDLPLHLYRGYFLEKRFGLSRLTPRKWLVREAKHLAVGGVLSLILLEGFYALLRYAPVFWPVWATVAWVGFSVVLARIFPVLILPFFYPVTPLDEDDLRRRLQAFGARFGFRITGVFRLGLGTETRKANAMLAGLGKTRRVLLSDTLLDRFSTEEIEGVFAHELAHYRFNHIPKGLAWSVLGSGLIFTLTAAAAPLWTEPLGLNGLADPAGLPVLLLWLTALQWIGMPFQHGLSRRYEWQADRFAVEQSPAAPFASALEKLADLNLADPDPPRWIEVWFYDHPAIARRIAAARAAVNYSDESSVPGTVEN